MKERKLPKTIYIYWDGDNEPFLSPATSINGISDGVKVGIYSLVEVKTMVVTEELG